MDESVTEISRGLVPHVVGSPMKQGYVILTLYSNPDKKILCKDSDGVKYFNRSTNQWELMPEQKSEYTKNDFETYGETSIPTITGLKNEVVKWLVRSTDDNEYIFFDSHLNNTILKTTFDCDTAVVERIKTLSIPDISSSINIVCALSFDRGNNYYTLINNEWEKINIDNKVLFEENGINIMDLPSIDTDKWTEMHPRNIRFAFCISELQNFYEPVIPQFSLVADMLGAWQGAANKIDYQYKYTNVDRLEITFLEQGDYKVNYLDKYEISGV